MVSVDNVLCMKQLLDCLVLFFNVCMMLVTLAESTLEFESKRDFGSRWIERNETFREFSHVIYIQMERATDVFCSGTMIHERWVLTAARCLYGNNSKVVETNTSLTLFAGVEDVDDLESDKVQVRQSKKVRIHNVKGLNDYYSVALVEVSTPFERTSKFVEDILVSDNNYLEIEDNVCKVGGFGYTRWHNRSTVLKCQEVDLHEENNETCPCGRKLVNTYPELNGEWFCGKSSVGVCRGDFGAGLICDEMVQAVTVGLLGVDKDDCNQDVIMGSTNCGGETTWAIFADVCYHLSWIKIYIPTVDLNTTACRNRSASRRSDANDYALFVFIIIVLLRAGWTK